jgi:hypothetical protein
MLIEAKTPVPKKKKRKKKEAKTPKAARVVVNVTKNEIVHGYMRMKPKCQCSLQKNNCLASAISY